MRIIVVFCALFACTLAATIQQELMKIDTRDTMDIDNDMEDFLVNITEVETMGLLSKRASCESDFEKEGRIHDKRHTMCKYSTVTDGFVTKDEIKEIINKHNSLRSDPKTSKKAKAMCKMYWDPQIAEIAQYYADSCPSYAQSHDKLRDVPGYGIGIGQNMGWGYDSWNSVIQAWFDEVKFFKFGKGAKKKGDVVGHYTQVVTDKSCRVGCGYAKCGNVKTYICNYAVGQQSFSEPFEPGQPCSGCPNKCSGGKLCDCKGKMCYNAGTLNMKTCGCSCPNGYSGSSCEELTCPSDPSFCGKEQPNGYPKNLCFFSIVSRTCNVMCGICKKANSYGENYVETPSAKLMSGSGKFTTTPGVDNGRNNDYENLGANNVGNSGGNKGGNKDCKDHDYCKNPAYFHESYCQLFPDFEYLPLNGVNYSPSTLCPKTCETC